MSQSKTPSTVGTAVSGVNRDFSPVTFTRNAFNKHRTTSRWSAVGDVYQTFLGAAVILMYAGSLFYGVQQDLVVDSGSFLTRSLASGNLSLIPAVVAMDLLLVLATAYGLVFACRVGPVAVDRAQGYWWLSLPVDRRKLVLGPVAKKVAWAGSVAGLFMVPLALLSGPADGFVSVALASLTTFFLAAVVLAAAASVHLLGKQRIVERCVQALSGIVLLLLLLPVVAPQTDEFFRALSTILPALPSSWPLLVAHGTVWPLFVMVGLAVLGCITVYTKLGRFRRADLIAAGEVTGHASSALYFGDFRELGQALKVGRSSRIRFQISRWAPKSSAGILIFTDLVAFIRKPQLVGMLLGLALLPGAVTLVEGMGSAILVVVVLFFTSWRVAVVSSTIARQYADQPMLDRLLPLGVSAQLRLHAVVPLLAAVAWSAVAFGLLVFLGASSEDFNAPGLLGMGLISSVGLAGAGMRMAYRPAPDWAGMDGSTLSGLQSNGTIASYTRGPDFVFLAMLPTMLALLTGTLTWWLILLQIATSMLCLWLSTRRD